MNVEKIGSLNFDIIYKVLSSSNISDATKTKFIYKNRFEINNIVEKSINDDDFNWLMQNRALKKFRPIKNSFTKRGDKIILAKSLNIPVSDVPKYIKNVTNNLKHKNELAQIENVSVEKLKTYIYRHGNQDELVVFFDNELSKSKNIKKTLENNLKYNTNGLADYFIRPIHRMKNQTLIELFNVINKNISTEKEKGSISQKEMNEILNESFIKLYKIQQNSKLINALKKQQL